MEMMETALTYLLLASALAYLAYRGYLTFRKKSEKGCASCPANK